MSKEEKKDNPNQINIELSEEVAEGIYSNLVMIAHSNSEFVLDFIRLMPGVPKAKVKSRIVVTPEHAKRLLRVDAISGLTQKDLKNNPSYLKRFKEQPFLLRLDALGVVRLRGDSYLGPVSVICVSS